MRPRTAPCHVRGLATPFAASTADPTGARGAGASLGFALQGFARDGRAPLGALAVLTFLRGDPPLREARRRPPSRRCSRREPRDPDPRGPESTSFLGFSPSEPSPPPSGPSLVVARPALPPFRGVTFRPAGVSGPYEAEGSAGPSPDCRLPWGFAPSDRRGAPYVDPGSGLMDSPHGGDRLRDRPPL